MGLMRGRRQRRAQAHGPRRQPPRDDPGPAARPGRGPAAAGLLLRHARPRAERGGRRGARPPDPGRPGDTVDQAAPGRPERPAARASRARRRFNVEVDVLPGGFVCSARSRADDRPRDARRPSTGATPLRKLFSKEQRAFFAAHAPDGIDARRARPRSGRRSCSRRSSTPRRSSTASASWRECGSTRTARGSSSCRRSACRAEAFQVAAEARAYLASKGVDLERRAADEDQDGAALLPGRAQADGTGPPEVDHSRDIGHPGTDDDASSGGDHDQGVGCQAGGRGGGTDRDGIGQTPAKAKTTKRAPRKTAAKPA